MTALARFAPAGEYALRQTDHRVCGTRPCGAAPIPAEAVRVPTSSQARTRPAPVLAATAPAHFVACSRVNTDGQGRSGLGLEAQRAA